MAKLRLAWVRGMLPMAMSGVKTKGCEKHRKGYCISCVEKYGEVCSWQICCASRRATTEIKSFTQIFSPTKTRGCKRHKSRLHEQGVYRSA